MLRKSHNTQLTKPQGMGGILPSAFLLVMLWICSQAAEQENFEALKSCFQENCLYTYSAYQQSSVSGKQSEVHIASTVEVFCDSTGIYKEQAATKYCFKLKDTSVSIFDKDSEARKSLNEASSDANQQLSGPFCFVQGEGGKIMSVYYNPTEKTPIVNYKKGIAAAFQANFKKTEVEIEEDSHSKHYARYSFENIAHDHVIMHRTVDSENVIQLAASELHGKPLVVQKAEHVEYKRGRMLSSAGTTTIRMEGPLEHAGQSNDDATSENDSDTDDTFGDGGLSGTGKYLLKLQRCEKKSKSFIVNTNTRELTEGTLAAQFDEDEYDRDERYRLKQSLPSIRQALIGLQKDFNDAITIDSINKLLALESKHGPTPGYEPALAEVMDYLNTLSPNAEEDFEMRSLLYSFIASEGSTKSQETILRSMKTSKNERENLFLKQQLAFVRNVHPDILLQIEDIIASSGDITEPLILSYGALASAAAPKLQERIVQFLLDRMDAQAEDHTALIHLVHSLGNTEASFSDRALLGLIVHNNPSVRAAAVYALRHRLQSKDVQNALKLALRANRQDSDFAEMVTRTLIAGAESAQFSRTEHAVDDSLIEELLHETNGNDEVEAMVHFYAKILGRKALRKLKNKESVHAMKEIQSSSAQSGSWDSTSDPLFNLVSDINTRRGDVRDFPRHKSLLWTKPLGVPVLKLDIAFGAFAGFPSSPNTNRNFKLFAKGYARAYAYGYSKTAFEALILSEHRPGSPSMTGKVYFEFIGKVLVNEKVETCKAVTKPLLRYGPNKLLIATARVFIYVGFLEFSITLSARLGVSASIKACVAQCVSAKGNVVPTITVTTTVGAASNLIDDVRAGIDISASFDYNAFPEVTASYGIAASATEFCFNIKHGWPKNYATIYAYYQHRTILWCKGIDGISYPCGFQWSDKHKWNAESYDWQLPSYGPGTLWSSCDKLQCPAITMQ